MQIKLFETQVLAENAGKNPVFHCHRRRIIAAGETAVKSKELKTRLHYTSVAMMQATEDMRDFAPVAF